MRSPKYGTRAPSKHRGTEVRGRLVCASFAGPSGNKSMAEGLRPRLGRPTAMAADASVVDASEEMDDGKTQPPTYFNFFCKGGSPRQTSADEGPPCAQIALLSQKNWM